MQCRGLFALFPSVFAYSVLWVFSYLYGQKCLLAHNSGLPLAGLNLIVELNLRTGGRKEAPQSVIHDTCIQNLFDLLRLLSWLT